MKCEFCGMDESLPFVCNYCGGVFCADHRLPEAHQCKGDLTQRRTVIAPPQPNYSWSGPSYAPRPEIKAGSPFSRLEVRDIAIAYLSLGLAWFIVFIGSSNLVYLSPSDFLRNLPGGSVSPAEILVIALVAVGPGFVLHELSHKFVARRYGHWAEFRMWPLGLLLALVTSFLGFIFAAPGATYISGTNITKKENGMISLAGPLINVVIAFGFAPLLFSENGFYQVLGLYGVYINVFLAMFNMLPLFVLDGAKVFAWSKVRWASLFVPLFLVFLLLLRLFFQA
ncbi:MAG TPA: AN1-type zinc finger domain-containing protein [Nitrososphaerales archaeon]|nr:AN1-type zinc finger domain-containing protein [Nitrososphaerales archaeon]